jgi:hypothetical protein
LSLLDALWHVLNFLAPALVVPLVATLLAKLVWRKALRSRQVVSLWWPASAASGAVLVVGLVVFERDGKMATYLALVLATAVVLWWRGLRRT